MGVDSSRWRSAQAHGRVRSMCLVLALVCVAPAAAHAGALRVVVTVPDLASLAQEIGGEEVEVSAFVRGPQDAHFLDPRPSFIRALSRADLFAFVGLSLEVAWLSPLLTNARNTRIQPGRDGHFDASVGIPRLGVITGDVDRSAGDVHPFGSPHYLLDPVMGLHVARRLEQRLTRLRPERADYFAARYSDFERRLIVRLVGEALADALGAERVAQAALEHRLGALLAAEQQRDGGAPLGGWLAAMAPHAGALAIADHDLWDYLEARFDFRIVDFLEPRPGVAPTTRHLAEVAERMQSEGIGVILATPYFHPRYAEKLSQATGAKVVEMVHQVGARPDTEDYLSMVDWNVRALAGAL